MIKGRVRIAKLLAQGAPESEQVVVCGWVKSKRVSKKFAFLVINDGSSQNDLQVIIDADQECFAAVAQTATGAAVQICGQLVSSPGKGQDWELHAKQLEVLGAVDSETYPLQKKGHSLEFLREIGHLRGRTNTFGAVYRLRNRLSFAVHEFFQQRGFQWAHTPILTANDCEGAGELFAVTTLDMQKLALDKQNKVDYSQDFFGKPTHLTVSGQLNAEALALCAGDVYTFGPTFRAENSNTTRHLAEFWMVEPEMAFADLQDAAQLAQEMLQHLLRCALKDNSSELEFLQKFYPDCDPSRLEALTSGVYERMTYTDAIKALEPLNQDFEYKVSWGVDLQTEHERCLTEKIVKGPVIVTDYPKDIKAFYMRVNDDGRTVAAMDVLLPRIGEIIGGSQREERLAVLKQSLATCQIPEEGLEWYLDLRRMGGCPHAGYGMGFERLVQYVTGMANIRDTIPFSRTPGSISF